MLDDFLSKFSEFIQDKQIVINVGHQIFNRKWLSDPMDKKTGIDKDEFGTNPEEKDVDKKDKIILRELTKNSKTSLLDISKKVDLSSPQVLYRIKKLKRENILKRNTIDIDLDKFNRQFAKVFLYLKNISTSRINKLKKFCSRQKDITALSEVLGPWDIELEFEVKDFNSLMEVMNMIRKKFPDLIKNFGSVIITRESGRIHLPKKDFS